MARSNKQVKYIYKPLCFLFAALLVISWLFFGILYGNGNVSFSTPDESGQEASTGGMIIGEGDENGISLLSAPISTSDYGDYGISTLALAAYNISATITPDDATHKEVDWTVSFVNASSEWASGKTVTEYVTITPTSDGALTVTVECLQAFGEQIIVTVTSRENSSVSATCTVDYLKRDVEYSSPTTITFTGSEQTFTPVVKISDDAVGTLTPDLSVTSFFIDTIGGYSIGYYTDEILYFRRTSNNASIDFDEETYFDHYFSSSYATFTDITDILVDLNYDYDNDRSSSYWDTVSVSYISVASIDEAVEIVYGYCLNILYSYQLAGENFAAISVRVQLSYNDAVYDTFNVYGEFSYDVSALVTGVTGLSLSEDYLIY